MAGCLLRYSDYRESRLPWLGPIPSHWEIRRNGRIFAQRSETGFADLPILEVSLRTGVRVRDFGNSLRKQAMSDRSKYKRAAAGDITYNMMRLWQGAVGVAPVDGLVSPAYVVARPYSDVDARYFAYLFRTDSYKNLVNQYSRGIVVDRNRLYWDEFKQMPSVFPPPDEQRRIADFLDRHGRYVQKLIRNKRRVVELLNEQKQSIIDQAVTRGLNPNARLKPSGVEWLGEVPEHWNVLPIKQVAEVRLSGVDKLTIDGEVAVRLCNYTHVYNRDLITDDIDFMHATATRSEILALSLRKGDVLITKDSEMWDDIAVPALVNQDLEDVLCGYHLALIRPRLSQVDGEYLYRCFLSPTLVQQFNVAATGITRYGISKDAIKSAIVPLPPLREQRQICQRIHSELAPIDASMDRTRREIDLIREYRARLIADAVTGQLDVRGVALPSVEGLEDSSELDREDGGEDAEDGMGEQAESDDADE